MDINLIEDELIGPFDFTTINKQTPSWSSSMEAIRTGYYETFD
jgi:hypothetical protein